MIWQNCKCCECIEVDLHVECVFSSIIIRCSADLNCYTRSSSIEDSFEDTKEIIRGYQMEGQKIQ